MIRKNMSLILAVGITIFQCAKLTQPYKPKITCENQTKLVQARQINQEDEQKFYNGCEYQKSLSKNDAEKSKCSNCINANNCPGCAFSKNDSKGWISLDDLPQLDSLTTIKNE